jgi:hypothetical protein
MHHLSIRVPWHDGGWTGTVCNEPASNTACLVLRRIHETKDDAAEQRVKGRRFDELPQAQLPPCHAEHASFMSPHALTRKLTHPHVGWSPAHAHFAPTPFSLPTYSAGCIPFRWMLKDGALEKAEGLQLRYDKDAEDHVDYVMGRPTGWVQVKRNQLALLDTFFSAVQPEESLCFFYAKDTPLADDPRRVIVGVGRVKHVGDFVEYDYSAPGELTAVIWERAVQHSIRPGFADGFLFPYHELVDLARQDPELTLERFVAFAPDEAFSQFSFASELVTHDSAVASLLACSEALRRIGEQLPGRWQVQQAWLDTQLNRLWQLRGPYPGFGSALKALGVEHGMLVAYDIGMAQANARQEWREDPWALFEAALLDPNLLGPLARKPLTRTIRDTYTRLPAQRKALLRLLSRFSIGEDQAIRFFDRTERSDAGIEVNDTELLSNPYLLYELDRVSADAIALPTVDRGLFPDPIVLERHPLPDPSALDGSLDARRIRAFGVRALESAADDGHTLLPADNLVRAVRRSNAQPPCALSLDILETVEAEMAPPLVKVELCDGSPAWQLARLTEVRQVIRAAVTKRKSGRRHTGTHDWRALVDQALDTPAVESTPEDALTEERARQEKAAALQELYEARLSVLVGPAGTGKTTLIRALCSLPDVKGDGVLLLAPTGKARVRMETAIKVGRAQTIAQFLIALDRYDPATGRYLVGVGRDPVAGHGTVVIDEASMLTEEQLAAVIDAVTPPKRLVLVGDPRQLPPIGAGRPFVDIVRDLEPQDVRVAFPRVSPGYAELTVQQRYKGQDRTDLLLAGWFTGREPGPGADGVWDFLARGGDSEFIKVVQWSEDAELPELLLHHLQEELHLSGDEELLFEESLGGKRQGSAVYFLAGRDGNPGAGVKAEDWQVLCPIRGGRAGVEGLNRMIQARFRKRARQWAEPDVPGDRKTARPMGRHRILYGDKVINVVNQRRKDVYPDEGQHYVANGEIGIVVGQFRGRFWRPRRYPWKLEVEFSSQLGLKYGYGKGEFGEEATQPLELGYALTVHKTQGSEFKRTFVILPNPCRLLSPELLYTALTRQRDRVILFHQGDLAGLRKYSQPYYSETARRVTNLLAAPDPRRVDDRFLEEGLIHRTRRGDLVRSKSEVIVADVLHSLGIAYEYERELKGPDGERRWPDFTVDDQASGHVVYWEHLGLLDQPTYRARWDRKLAWYRSIGVMPFEEGEGPNGRLVTSQDRPGGAIDSGEIASLARRVFGL